MNGGDRNGLHVVQKIELHKKFNVIMQHRGG